VPVRVALSLGDPSGVGPEVTAGALASLRRGEAAYAFADASFAERARAAGVRLPVVRPGRPLPEGGAIVAVTRLAVRDRQAGRPTARGAAAQLAYLEAAFEALARGDADALCTAPLNKAQVQRRLPSFVGHTEWLEARGGGARSVMMLAGRRLRVALATTHVSLRRMLSLLSGPLVADTAAITARSLAADLGIERPRLAVAGLNPHAGEGGAFGDEEERIVRPGVERARRLGLDVEGPFPPDSVFFRAALGEFDAVVALYHDQGLIPVKLLDALLGDAAVNVTLGLPFVRTSPDHGVAYDLAGTGRASDRSMRAALALAAAIARRRIRSRRTRR